MNHFISNSKMADIAFAIISLCLVTSISSSVGGDEGGCCSAARKVKNEAFDLKMDIGVLTGGNTRGEAARSSRGGRLLIRIHVIPCGYRRQQ